MHFNKWTLKLKPYKFQIIRASTTIHYIHPDCQNDSNSNRLEKYHSSGSLWNRWIDDRAQPWPCNQLENHSLTMGGRQWLCETICVTRAIHFPVFLTPRRAWVRNTQNIVNMRVKGERGWSGWKLSNLLPIPVLMKNYWVCKAPSHVSHKSTSLWAQRLSAYNITQINWTNLNNITRGSEHVFKKKCSLHCPNINGFQDVSTRSLCSTLWRAEAATSTSSRITFFFTKSN